VTERRNGFAIVAASVYISDRMTVKRSASARLLSAALLTWLSIVTIEPLGVHTCAMHGGSTVSASHAMHSMEHLGSGTPMPKSHSNQCGCPGDCASTGTLAVAAPTGITMPKPADQRAPRVIAREIIIGDRSTPRLLPFANGPPSDS